MREKAFTLVELMVVIGLFALLLSGGMVYINNFKSRQDLGLARDELINKLRLARNLARTGQKPTGSTEGFSYVEVLLDENGLITVVNDVGDVYFSEDIMADTVRVETVLGSGELLFLIHDAKLLKDDGGVVPRGVGESVVIDLVSVENQSEIRSVVIRSSGLIEDD